jgi:hypothetical protein
VLFVAWGNLLPAYPQEDPNLLDQQGILQFLNQTVAWYQRTAVEQQVATTPGDLLYATDDRPVGDQIVHLSFDFARAGAQLLDRNPSAGPASASGDSRYQNLSAIAARLDDESSKTQAELDSFRNKLEKVSPRERQAVESQIAETQSELALLQARRSVVRSMMQFIGGTTVPGGLEPQIEALERSVPIMNADTKTGANPSAALAAAGSSRAFEPTGIWSILRELFRLSEKIDTINENIRQTDALKQSAKRLQSPLMNRMKEAVRQSEGIASQPDSRDPVVLAQQKSTLDALTGQFKLLSSTLLPLSKQQILLDVYRKNLVAWQAAVKQEYSTNIKSLLVRLLA